MRTRGPVLAGVVAVAVAAVGWHSGAAAQTSSCAGADRIVVTETARRQALDTILCLVNAQRTARGLPKLARSARLAGVARRQSADMVRYKYVGHVSRAGLDVRTRVARSGYRARNAGEAIGWGTGMQRTPTRLMDNVLATAAHRRIVRGTRYRDVGVGLVLGAPVAGKSDGATLTLTFGRRR